MTIEKTKQDGKLIFALDGRLETSTAPQLQEVLIPAFDTEKEIVLDFGKLDYVSSAGLRVLLMGHKTAKSKGSKQVVTHMPSEIMEILEMTGFSSILNIE
jgi:anti-anti-sigma factor